MTRTGRAGVVAAPARPAARGDDAAGAAAAALERAARRLGLEQGVRDLLAAPSRALELAVPVALGERETRVLTGWRVVHDVARGPALGGLRLEPGAGLASSAARAMERTWTCALLDLPLGGADGAIRCDAATLGPRVRERAVRRWTAALAPQLLAGGDVLVPAPGTAACDLRWAADAFATAAGNPLGLSASGRAAVAVDVAGHVRATAAGLVDCLRLAVAREGLREPVDVAIAGLGAVGRAVAAALDRDPAWRVVAVGDARAARVAPHGLAVDALERALAAGAGLGEAPVGEPASLQELLRQPADVLIAAEDDAIADPSRAEQVAAPIVVEGAPAAVAAALRDELARRATLVPAGLAACGGLLAGVWEWARGGPAIDGPDARRPAWIRAKLAAAFADAASAAERLGVPLHEGALCAGVERAARAQRERGLWR